MARESIITILRSLSADTPTGLTFGEFGFAGASRKLFVGGTGGGATVESVWIGASITGEALENIVGDLWGDGQDANNTLSTSNAIKNYVDSAVGTKGDVNSVNDDIGIITITGAGNNAAVSVRSAVAGTHLIDARIATYSLTGVASFDPRHFALGASGHVSLTGSYQVTGDTVVAGNSISVSRSNNQATITNAGVTGITSGTVTYGNIGTNGIFLSGTTGNIQIQNTGVRSLSVQGSGVTADWYQKGPQIQGDGFNINVSAGYGNPSLGTNPYLKISSSGLYSLNGITSGALPDEGPFLNITGDSGAIRVVNDSNTATITFVPRIATASLTGVASFDPRHFAIGLSGHVSLTGSFSVTGDTVVAGNSISVSRSNNQATITNAGVTSIAFGNATLTGNVSLTSGSNVTMTVVGNQVTIATSGGGATTSALNTWTQTQTFNGGIQTTGLTATNGLSASGLVYFTNGLTAPGGIHTTGLTATTAVFNGLARFNSGLTTTGLATFNSGLTTTGLATFSNGLTAPGGIHTTGLTATTAVFNGLARFNSGLTTTGLATFNSGLTTTGLATFSNGLTSPGGIHTTGLTATTAVFNGLARFNSGLTTTGLATFSNGLTAPGGIHTRGLTAFNIVGTNASFASGGGVTFSGTSVFSSGLSATGITANTIFANNARFTNATFTNDVTVTGNLTVDGTVITANVETIIIEDPLIKLGTGNNADSQDIGFFGQYFTDGLQGDKRHTGLFRDASDGGRYKFFTGLTGGIEPLATINAGGAGYTIATLVVKLDGGTF
jgi:hypothetical protein